MNRRQRRAEKTGRRPAATADAARATLMAGIEHHQAGRLAAAEAEYRTVLDTHPSNPDALHLLGVVAHQGGRDGEALEKIGRAIAIDPAVALYHNNMGATLRALERGDEAIPHYREAVRIEPGYGEAYVNLGNALDDSGDSDGAVAAYEKALAIDADDADAHTGLGGALVKLGEDARAAEHFRRAVALDPGSALAHNNLGNHHLRLGAHDAAIDWLRRALAIDPAYVEALVNLGAALRDAFRPGEAEPLLRQALEREPENLRVLHTLGLVLKDLDRFADAESMFRRAIELRPDFAELWNDLGNLYRNAGRLDDAIEAFGDSLACNPDFDIARSNRSLLRLTVGDFSGGWSDYRCRASVAEFVPDLHREPLPDDLSGKRILLLMDQGLGDEIFFLRFAAELARRGAELVYRADPKIAGMVARLPFIARLATQGDRAPDFDLCLSVGDLPWLMGVGASGDIPPPLPLEPLVEADAAQRARLAALGAAPFIGVTWRAGVQRRNRLSKLAPMEAIADALRPVAATVVALQRAPRPGEIAGFAERLGRDVHDLTDLNDDLESMLGLVGHLDDYVCVSNTNVHLMTSRGRSCRVLVPYPPDYRWMDRGDESPWFPGTSVYREVPGAGWDAAHARLAADLAAAHGG